MLLLPCSLRRHYSRARNLSRHFQLDVLSDILEAVVPVGELGERVVPVLPLQEPQGLVQVPRLITHDALHAPVLPENRTCERPQFAPAITLSATSSGTL